MEVEGEVVLVGSVLKIFRTRQVETCFKISHLPEVPNGPLIGWIKLIAVLFPNTKQSVMEK